MTMQKVNGTARPVPADTPPQPDSRPAPWVRLEAEVPVQAAERINWGIDG